MFPSLPAAAAAPHLVAELAAGVVRSERTLARRAARQAAAQRVTLARSADAVAVVALLLPWVREGALLRDGLQVSPGLASLALMSVALRQIVLAVACAQPDHRSRIVLLGISLVTGFLGVVTVLETSSTVATRPGERIAAPFALLLFAAASMIAAACAADAGRRLAAAMRHPVDVLAGMSWALPHEVWDRLGDATATPQPSAPDGEVAARLLTRAAAATAAIGCVAAGLMPWVTRLDTLPFTDVLGPGAGSRPALLLGLVALALVAVLSSGAPSGMRRSTKVAGLLGAAALSGVAAVSALLDVAAHRSEISVAGPGGWLAIASLGCSCAFALLAGSALYEAWHRDVLRAGELDAAAQRTAAVLRPPDVLYYVD